VTRTTVAQDEGVRGIQARLNGLEEEKARLLTRHHLLSHATAHALDQRIPVPPEVAGVTPAAAREEMDKIDRELAVLARRIDGEHARLTLADVAAQATLAEAATPEYRRLVAARDRAQAVLDECERDIQMFLTDLRRRGVYQTPRIAEKA
jgi:hypothetical protein